jgi:hypothetical protein
MSAETNILRHELAETRRLLAAALARIDALHADKTYMRRFLSRIEHESNDQFACEMAKAALK